MVKCVTLIFLFFLLGLLVTTKNTYASEGIIQIRSLTQENYRCFATSVLMQDFNYLISATCRNLKYPADNSILYYILWATPTNGGTYIKLAELGLGRISTKTKTPFKNLFITLESDPKIRYPSGKVVMKGDVEKIAFLEPIAKDEPTPTISNLSPTELLTSPTPNQDNTNQEKQSSKDKLLIAVQKAGIAAGIVLVILVGVIFAVSRAKG
ncbi:MAG: hypothetical protein NZM26_03315 [Patescibacteria group bacterium]|nr:hypothetical protein [Patescibacteria group bacterium]